MNKNPGLFCDRLRRTALRIGLSLVLASGVLASYSVAPIEAQARSESDYDSTLGKAYWQGRYRTLRDQAARLRRTAEVARANYAAANRRNYRRGTNRSEQRMAALEAEAELVKVEADLAGLDEEARVNGALPGWLREVRDEPTANRESVPAVEANRLKDDGGRNPHYHDK